METLIVAERVSFSSSYKDNKKQIMYSIKYK